MTDVTQGLAPPAPPPNPPPFDGRATWLAVATLLSVVALLVGAVALGVAEHNRGSATIAAASATPSVPSTATVHLSEFKIDPADLTVAQGGTLDVMNAGAMTHNLAVDGTSLATAMINAGSSSSLSLGNLDPGTYTIYCQVPGHREAGMHAVLHVVKSGTSAAQQASPASTSSSTPMSWQQMDASMAASIKAFPAATKGVGAQLLAPTVLPDGTKRFDVTAEIVPWEVSQGKVVQAWTYNGTVPGPTMQVNVGDKVEVVLHNHLSESTTLHFHGIDGIPFADDGVGFIAQPPVAPGTDFTYSFTPTMPGIGLYHPHEDAVTQMPNGMFGALLVGDMPIPAPNSVVPAGITVTGGNQPFFLDDAGVIGLTFNGKSFPATAPYTAKAGQWIEVTYYGAGEMGHPVHLHEFPQLVIAEDGYPLASPYYADTVNVAPGQRFTVLIHATVPGTWAWHCHILPHVENSTGMYGMVTALVVS